MFTITQLPSRNRDVRVFRISIDSEPAALMIEAKKPLEASDWTVYRFQDWGWIARFKGCDVKEALAQAGALSKHQNLLKWSEDQHSLAILTGYGRRVFYAVTDGKPHLSSGDKKIIHQIYAHDLIYSEQHRSFVENELLAIGDWPVEHQMVNERTHEVVLRITVGEPAPKPKCIPCIFHMGANIPANPV